MRDPEIRHYLFIKNINNIYNYLIALIIDEGFYNEK